MKRFYDIKNGGQPYDAVGRRKGQELFYILGGNKVAPGGASSGPTAMQKAPTKMPAAPKVSTGHVPSSGSAKTSGVGIKAAPAKVIGAKGADQGDASKLQAEIQDLRMNMDTVEKERDFYFGKLRDIELLLQANESKKTSLTDNVLKILYASEEEKVLICENGEL